MKKYTPTFPLEY